MSFFQISRILSFIMSQHVVFRGPLTKCGIKNHHMNKGCKFFIFFHTSCKFELVYSLKLFSKFKSFNYLMWTQWTPLDTRVWMLKGFQNKFMKIFRMLSMAKVDFVEHLSFDKELNVHCNFLAKMSWRRKLLQCTLTLKSQTNWKTWNCMNFLFYRALKFLCKFLLKIIECASTSSSLIH